MNYKFEIEAGGVFSKYMFAIQNSIKYEIDEVYLNVIDERTIPNIFENIFDQKLDDEFNTVGCENLPVYDKNNKIEDSEYFEKYKNFISKLKLKKNILKKVDEYVKKLNINEKTVGVHLRLTDMNIHHAELYGTLTIENYLAVMNKNETYFVASDNHESIEKLKKIFGNKIKYVPKMIRCKKEDDDSTILQLDNFKNEKFWVEAFIEMLLLSKCNKIICRTSNLINASIIHSDNIKEIIRL